MPNFGGFGYGLDDFGDEFDDFGGFDGFDSDDNPYNDPSSLEFQLRGHGGFGYDTSHVPRDEAEPAIVKAAGDGNLKRVQELLREEMPTEDDLKFEKEYWVDVYAVEVGNPNRKNLNHTGGNNRRRKNHYHNRGRKNHSAANNSANSKPKKCGVQYDKVFGDTPPAEGSYKCVETIDTEKLDIKFSAKIRGGRGWVPEPLRTVLLKKYAPADRDRWYGGLVGDDNVF
jgi:hypothetical protein